MGRLIQGTAQPEEWCWSRKRFFLARVEVRRTLLGNHHLPLPVSSQPCEEAGTSRLSIWQTCSQGCGWQDPQHVRGFEMHLLIKALLFLPTWDSGLNKELCFGSPCAGVHRDVHPMALDIDSTEVSLCAQTPPGHISSWFTINIHSRASELLWECPFLATDGRSGQR